MTDRIESAMHIDDMNEHIRNLDFDALPLIIEDVYQDRVQARLITDGLRTRPGGYITGPTMMSAVDLTGWLLVFTRIGLAEMALTWDLSINFLRPAYGADLIITGRQTKFGKLCHASYELALDGGPDRLVAHATTTYVTPPAT